MTQASNQHESERRRELGRKNYKSGYAFEDRVAEAYRLLGYDVEHGRLFGARQVDLYLELRVGDLLVRRAIECKAGPVNSDLLDRFLIKFDLVRREYPDALGTVISGSSFTNEVRTHANSIGIQLTLYRDLSAQILDAASYIQALVREIRTNDRYLPDLFVEPIIGSDPTGEGRDSFDFLRGWLEDGSWNQLTLLGDVGTGKSFLSRMLALQLANEFLKNPEEAPFPLLIDLRKADREFSLEGLVLTHFAKYGLSRATFEAFQFLLAEGRIILILDGFDEMASRVTPVITTRNFHELARSVKRSAKVLLTCRTHYFKSRTEEEEVVIGGSASQSSEAARDLYWDLISRGGFKIAYLRPFTISQVEEYVRRARPNDAEMVLAKIRSIYNLSELSQRPLLLEMIVKSIDRLNSSEINPAQLYEVFTGAWIHRDRWRDLMRPEDKLKFLTGLARSLWEQEKTSIGYQQLEAYIGTELASLIDSPQKLTELDGEIRTASFLVRDHKGQYSFAHSSYAEYFLAKYLSAPLVAGEINILSVRRLTNEVVDFLLWMVDRTLLEERLTAVLMQEYQPLLSENALIVLYRLRRRLLLEEKGRGSDGAQLEIEMPAGVRLKGARLAQVNLEGAILHDAELDGADLRQCIAIGADFSGSSLKEALLGKSNFQSASLRNVNAIASTLNEANFSTADVSGCNFTGADLSGSIFAVKTFADSIFDSAISKAAILPPLLETTMREAATPVAIESQWDKEQALKRVFVLARNYARRMGAGADSEDVASEVVVYLLSNPKELAIIREGRSAIGRISRTLAWHRISSQRAMESSRRKHIFDQDHHKGIAGWAENEEDELRETAEGYLIDRINSGSSSTDDGTANSVESEHDSEELIDYSTEDIPDVVSSLEATDPNIRSELLDILGTSLSQDSLAMLIARYVEEESVGEIAKRLGISEIDVVRQLNKARELARRALRTTIDPDGANPTTG